MRGGRHPADELGAITFSARPAMARDRRPGQQRHAGRRDHPAPGLRLPDHPRHRAEGDQPLLRPLGPGAADEEMDATAGQVDGTIGGCAAIWCSWKVAPSILPVVERDVINPIFGAYYRDAKTPPANYLSPSPIFFLALGSRSRYRFGVASLSGDREAAERGVRWLQGALTELGVGAKTGAGYGYWELDADVRLIPREDRGRTASTPAPCRTGLDRAPHLPNVTYAAHRAGSVSSGIATRGRLARTARGAGDAAMSALGVRRGHLPRLRRDRSRGSRHAADRDAGRGLRVDRSPRRPASPERLARPPRGGPRLPRAPNARWRSFTPRRLAELAREFEPKGVAFIGIASNRRDTDDAARPVRGDARPAIPAAPGSRRRGRRSARRRADAVESSCWTTGGAIRYRGRIDDQYAVGSRRAEPRSRDLRDALEDLLAGRPVAGPRPRRSAARSIRPGRRRRCRPTPDL